MYCPNFRTLPPTIYDPYSLLEEHFTWGNVSKCGLIPFKATIILACCLIVRVLLLLICFPTLSAYLMFSCISYLARKADIIGFGGRAQVTQYLLKYSSCEIILGLLQQFSSPCVSIFMFYGFILTILYSFISLKMYHIVPMPLFLFFPTLAVFVPVIIQIMLPGLITIYEDSTSLREKWGGVLHLRQDLRGVVRRQIRGKRSLSVYAGVAEHNFFKCKRSTMVTYYEAIVGYVITALMSVDVYEISIEF